MTTRPPRLSAFAAAAALSIVTFAVFNRLQDYGPESAIRRFHEDVADHHEADLQRVTVQSILERPPGGAPSDAWILIGQVAELQRRGATYQIVRMDRSPNQVNAAVVYTMPDGMQEAMVWVVERSGQAWRINAAKTVTILRDLLPGVDEPR